MSIALGSEGAVFKNVTEQTWDKKGDLDLYRLLVRNDENYISFPKCFIICTTCDPPGTGHIPL